MIERDVFFKNPYREGATVHMQVDKIAYGGDGLGRVGSFVMFVTGAVPGDIIEARIIETRRNHLRGYLVNIIQPSPNRVPAPCPVYDQCGGCQLQEIDYSRQLNVKMQILNDCLRDLKVTRPFEFDISPIIASPEHFGYRLRCQLKTAIRKGRRLLGFYAKRSNNLVPVEHCPLLIPKLNEAIPTLTESLNDAAPHSVDIRSVELVSSSQDDAIWLTLIMRGKSPPVETLYQRLKTQTPNLIGLSLGQGYPSVAEGTLTEDVDGVEYRLSLGSFFQVNRFMLETLRETAIGMLDPGPEDVIVDLYCGVGFFTVPLARRSRMVTGVETNLAAVQDAQYNASRAEVNNVKFMARPAERFRFDRPGGRAPAHPVNMAFLDPPRQGCHNRLIENLVNNPLDKILYLSCNPTTQVRDLNALIEGGYRLVRIQPFDMFPQTYHLETAALLVKS